MWLRPLLAILIALLPHMGRAQTTDAESQATAGANNTLTFNGGATSAPPVSSHSTAPCVVGGGIGLGITAVAIGFTSGRMDRHCLAKADAEFLVKVLRMPPSREKRAVIYHACANSPSLRRTLVAVGACVIKRR